MKKEQAQGITNDIMIADALLRVKTLENILIAKGIFTREEYNKEMEEVTKVIAKAVLEKAGAAAELLKDLQAQEPKKPQN